MIELLEGIGIGLVVGYGYRGLIRRELAKLASEYTLKFHVDLRLIEGFAAKLEANAQAELKSIVSVIKAHL